MSEAEPPSAAREEHSVDARLTTPGAITYLHIPATDVRESAAFYREVFSWKIENPDTERPSFDDASGHLSGAWVSDQAVARAPGLLPYIYVEEVEETTALILAHGGEIVERPFPEGLLVIATFRDPATSSGSGTTLRDERFRDLRRPTLDRQRRRTAGNRVGHPRHR
jgi:predicted enzyme related to lactoylglutathione lyase